MKKRMLINNRRLGQSRKLLLIMKKKFPNYDESMWKGAPQENFLKATELRRNMTEAEKVLWERLRNNQLQGIKFRRQHPVHLFIADFYCHKHKLIIEIDGEYHHTEDQKSKDCERTKLLEFQGLKILRFTNEEVINSTESVINKIKHEINIE